MLKALSLLAAGEIRNAVNRKAVVVAFFAAAGLIFLFAIGFLLAALHSWLSLRLGGMEASLYIGLGLLAIAGVVAGLGVYKSSRPAPTDLNSTIAAGAAIAAPLAAQGFLKRANLGTAAIIAVVVGGALLGRRMTRN